MQQQEVYLNHHHAGTLRLKKNGELEFTYTDSWLKTPQAVPLSIRLPLKHQVHSDRYAAPFFRSFQKIFEGAPTEQPGAISFAQPNKGACTTLTVEEVEKLLDQMPVATQGIPLPLKISIIDNEFCLNNNGGFNTHLLKRYGQEKNNDLINNEIFCTLIASHLGLATANVLKINLKDGSYLMIERTDRLLSTTSNKIYGIPSETVSQALPELSAKKPLSPLAQVELIFKVLRSHGSIPILDVKDLTLFIVMCLLCGIDSAPLYQQRLQHRPSGVNLLPFTDLVCTAILSPQDSLTASWGLPLIKDFRKVNTPFFHDLAKSMGVNPKYLSDVALRCCEQLPRLTKGILNDYPALNTSTTQMISHLILSRTAAIKNLLKTKN